MAMFPDWIRPIVWCGWMGTLGTCLAQGQAEEPRPCTLDLPVPRSATLPAWLSGVASSESSTLATWELGVVPPDDDAELAVTFYFQDPKSGFLRVFWKGASSEMLSENLAEGIGLPNQRTLVVRRALLSAPGTLGVQSGEGASTVWRIRLEWVRPKPVPHAEGAPAAGLVEADGRVRSQVEVSGSAPPSEADRMEGRVATAVLTDKPERIEQGVVFVAPIEVVPRWARVEAWFSGVPLERKLALWVNDQNMGEVAMEIPDFSDAGYFADAEGKARYAGWRKGAVLVPVEWLKAGDNRFQIGWGDEEAGSEALPIAVKNFRLQLRYPDAAALPPGPPAGDR